MGNTVVDCGQLAPSHRCFVMAAVLRAGGPGVRLQAREGRQARDGQMTGDMALRHARALCEHEAAISAACSGRDLLLPPTIFVSTNDKATNSRDKYLCLQRRLVAGLS